MPSLFRQTWLRLSSIRALFVRRACVQSCRHGASASVCKCCSGEAKEWGVQLYLEGH